MSMAVLVSVTGRSVSGDTAESSCAEAFSEDADGKGGTGVADDADTGRRVSGPHITTQEGRHDRLLGFESRASR